jgi:mono/diheme cytochrome c family protein
LKQCKYIIKGILLLCIGVAGFAVVSKYGTVPLVKEQGFACGVVDNEPLPATYVNGSIDGKVLFQRQCQSCHAIYKDLTGPGLAGVIDNPFWSDKKKLANYIRKPDAFKKDPYIAGLRKKFGSAKQAFPEMQDEEILMIMQYASAGRAAY